MQARQSLSQEVLEALSERPPQLQALGQFRLRIRGSRLPNRDLPTQMFKTITDDAGAAFTDLAADPIS